MTATRIRYSGITHLRKRVTNAKANPGDLTAWVLAKHRQGWLRLTVFARDDDTRVLAKIGPKVEGGGRVWWVAP